MISLQIISLPSSKECPSTRQVTSKRRIELLCRRIKPILIILHVKGIVSAYESEKVETGSPIAKKCDLGDVLCFSWLAARNLQICQISVELTPRKIKKRSQIFLTTCARRIEKNGLKISPSATSSWPYTAQSDSKNSNMQLKIVLVYVYFAMQCWNFGTI